MDEAEIKIELKDMSSFKGVYACNEFKSPSMLPASYVFNTDPRSKPGRHWVALFIDKRRNGFFFDSFGLKPKASMMNFIRRVCKSARYNKLCLQHTKSISCAVYCIYFLRRCNKMAPEKSIANLQAENKINNELKLIDYFIDS